MACSLMPRSLPSARWVKPMLWRSRTQERPKVFSPLCSSEGKRFIVLSCFLYSLGIMPSFWKLPSTCTSSGKEGQAQLSLSQGSFRGEYSSISWGSHYASDSMSLPLASHLWVTQEERDVLLSAGRFPRVLPSQSSFRLDAACISFCLLVSGDQ